MTPVLMKGLKAFVVALLWIGGWGFGSGCQHGRRTTGSDAVMSGAKLRPRAVAYVAIPPDAMHKEDLVVGSGRTMSIMVRDAFAKHTRLAYLARYSESFAESLATCRTHRCDYLVYPTIVRWEDRATEFSGIRDRVEIRISVYDPEDGRCLHSAPLRQRGPWLTSGGDTPSDLLPDMIQKYVAGLFQDMKTPTGIP